MSLGTTLLNDPEQGFNSSDERLGIQNQNAYPTDKLNQSDPAARPSTPKLEPPASSACLLDSGSPPMTYGMFYPMNLAQRGNPLTGPQASSLKETPLAIERDLMDQSIGPIYTPALMDTLVPEGRTSNSTPSFQKKKTQPKEVFETMRQKAGAEKSWAQIASSTAGKKKESKESTSFGVNVVVRGSFGRSQVSHASGPDFLEHLRNSFLIS
jgi:hypothetical protein